ERAGLAVCQSEVIDAELGETSACAKARQRERRLRPCDEHELAFGRELFDEELERADRRLIAEEVDVVENDDDLALELCERARDCGDALFRRPAPHDRPQRGSATDGGGRDCGGEVSDERGAVVCLCNAVPRERTPVASRPISDE